MAIMDPIINSIDSFLAWMGSSLGQAAESYCTLESADSRHALIARDGSLVSILKIQGVTYLVGAEEFERLHRQISLTLQASLARPGQALQVYFMQDKETIGRDLQQMLAGARQTAKQIGLTIDDLFQERILKLSQFCASEQMYFVLWTRPSHLTKQQYDQALKDKKATLKAGQIPPFLNAQNFLQGMSELKESHDSYVRSVLDGLNNLGLSTILMDVHDACRAIRMSVDPEFTDFNWRPYLPGDKLPVRESKHFAGDISDIFWPPLSSQLIPRNGENLTLRTARIGDRLYGATFIDLFPKELTPLAPYSIA